MDFISYGTEKKYFIRTVLVSLQLQLTTHIDSKMESLLSYVHHDSNSLSFPSPCPALSALQGTIGLGRLLFEEIERGFSLAGG